MCCWQGVSFVTRFIIYIANKVNRFDEKVNLEVDIVITDRILVTFLVFVAREGVVVFNLVILKD